MDQEERDRGHKWVALVMIALMVAGLAYAGHFARARFRPAGAKPASAPAANQHPSQDGTGAPTITARPGEGVHSVDCIAWTHDPYANTSTEMQKAQYSFKNDEPVGVTVVCPRLPAEAELYVILLHESGETSETRTILKPNPNNMTAAKGRFMDLKPGLYLLAFTYGNQAVAYVEFTIQPK